MTPWQAASGRRIAAVLALTATPALCLAHVGVDGHVHTDAIDALRAGFVHPLSGADHWAAMLAVGLWSAMTAKRAVVTPVIFAAMMVVGAMLGFMNAPIAVVEPLVACSVLVLGLLIAMRWHLPSWAAALLAAGFALVHGVAHGVELAGPEQYLSLAGMLAATLLIMSVGVLLGRWLPRHAPWLPRLGGAALALFGAVLLGPFA
ncbi:HupE/UreJ family protein [Piscinibacter terrae]|uniref:Urease accessory protein UreJ n=1 Tax=Piscinibacter terrae TaxID=2496871 RepID=A0A3N7HI33_9BURK|nr:HupE/UreJ family protein [Albitalea terrae]RQP21688.1 urease accessory protein UreJ [Albitalea terrae]